MIYTAMSTILLVLLFSITMVSTLNEQYIGDRVVKMTPHSNETLKEMAEYLAENNYDVWYEATVPDQPCGVRVPKNIYEKTKEYCKQRKIDFDVAIPDLKKAIDENLAENDGEVASDDDEWDDDDDDHYDDDDYSPMFNYTRYNRYDDIVTELHRLRFKYPWNIRVRTIGYSFENRPLKLVRITSNVYRCVSKPIIWIEAGAHAREWISVASGMRMIKQLLEQYCKNDDITKLLRDHVIYFVPVVNPDGYEYSFTNDRLWRKTRTTFNGEDCVGADVNRNYNVKWGGAGGSSPDPCSLIYHGKEPESEPCVRMYATRLRRIQKKLKAVWSLHSFLQLLLMPNSYTTTLPSDFPESLRIAQVFTAAVAKRSGTPYAFAPAPFLLSPANGVVADYTHTILKVTHSYVVELRDRGVFGFLLPTNQIEPTALETLDGIVAAVLAI